MYLAADLMHFNTLYLFLATAQKCTFLAIMYHLCCDSFVYGGHNGTQLLSDLRILHIIRSTPTPSKFTQLLPAIGVDGIISRLLKLVGEQPGARVMLSEPEMLQLCDSVKTCLAAERSLVQYPVPAQLYGDIHGQFYDLLKLFEQFGYPDNKKTYMFLGDYGMRCLWYGMMF